MTLPIKQVGLSTVYLRDVANVRDGFAPQTNIVRDDGHRGVLISILKAGNASTIDVVKGISPTAAACCPDPSASAENSAAGGPVDFCEGRRSAE